MKLVIPANSDALLIPPAIKQGAVLKESGKKVEPGAIEGISFEDGKIIVSAGSYLFELE